MPKPALIAVIGLAAALAGCANYRAAPIDAVRSAEQLDARRLDDPRLSQFLAEAMGSAPSGAWDLDRLTYAALFFHPDLDVAEAKLAAAKAAIATARQRPNPSLNTVTQLDPAGAASTTVGAAITLLVETGAKRAARTAKATASEEAARQDVRAAAWQVRGGVRTALLDLWIGGQRTTLSARKLDTERELVTLLEHRLQIGAASALDLARERTNRDQAEVAWRDAQQAEAVARTELATAVGVSAAALNGVGLSFAGLEASPPPDRLDGLRQAALTQRADVKAALARYQAAEAALRLQIANQYPNLTFEPGYNDQGDKKVSLPVAFDLPIFNQNRGPIAEAVAGRKEAAAQLRALQAQIGGAFDAAQTSRQQAALSLETANLLATEQQARQARMGKLFKAGEADRGAFVTGELEVAAAQLARLDAFAAERRAAGQLEDAAQQPLFGSTAPIELPSKAMRAESELVQ